MTKPESGTAGADALATANRFPLRFARKRLLISIAAVAFVAAWGLPTLIMPFAADQNWFALGARTILDGEQLYRDFWDQKTPLIYLLYAVPYAIAGDHFEAIRVLDLLNTLLAMTGVFLLTRRFFPERAALFGAATYGFVYLTSVGIDGLGETESFIAAPLTLGFALYAVRDQEPGVWRTAFVAGLLLGVAFAFKFSVLPFLLGLPAAELILRDRQAWSIRGAIQRLTWAASGFLLVQAGWIGYLLVAGVLDDFIDIQRRYTIPYQNLRWSPNDWHYFRFVLIASGDWLQIAWYLTVPAWVGLLLTLFRGHRQAGYFLGLLVLFGILSVWWQGKFFRYHWIILLPVLAPLAGYAFDVAVERLRALARPERLIALAALTFGLLLSVTDPLLATYDGYNYLADRLMGDLRRSEVDSRYAPVLRLNHELAQYVQAHSEAGETLYVWGVWPQALILSERRSPTRFVTNNGLRATWAPEAWRRELIDDLTAAPPRFIAVAGRDSQAWLVGTDETSAEHFCRKFPELRQIVDEQYVPVLNNGLFVLYDRTATEATADPRC